MQEQSSTTNQNHLASQFRVSRCPQPGSVARARSCKDLEHTAVEEAGKPKNPKTQTVKSSVSKQNPCNAILLWNKEITHSICKQIHFWQPRTNQKFIKKSSKVHQKFIKISQITISGSKISKVHQKFIKSSSKVHQKCNAARVKLHLLETVFN